MTAGMLWLSVYEAAEGHMSEERFGGMVNANMKAPLVQKSYRGKRTILEFSMLSHNAMMGTGCARRKERRSSSCPASEAISDKSRMSRHNCC